MSPASSEWAVAGEDGDALHDAPHSRLLREEVAGHLRSLAFACGVVAALPVGLSATGGLYLWTLLPQVGWAIRLQALAPLWLGVGLLAVAIAGPRRMGRGAMGAAAFSLLALAIGAFSASRLLTSDLFTGFVGYVGRQPLAVLAGFALVATGAELRWRAGTEDWGRRTLAAGAAILLVLYALPQRGKPFAMLLGEHIWRVVTLDMPSTKAKVVFVAGNMLGWLFDFFPMLLAAFALRLRSAGSSTGSLVGPAARYGLSGLLLLSCYRMWMLGFGIHGILAQVRTALLLAVVVGVASRAAEAVMRQLLEDSLPPWPPASTDARDCELRVRIRRWLSTPEEARRGWLDTDPAYVHPILLWLMGRRLGELARHAEWPSNAQRSPTDAMAEQALALLECRPLEEQAQGEPFLPWGTRLALHLSKKRGRLEAALAVAGLTCALALIWRAWQPQPNLAWALGAPLPAADELMSSRLPGYVAALASRNRDIAGERSAGGEAATLLRAEASEMHAIARGIDVELAKRVEQLTATSAALDLTGHLWSDTIHSINERIRELGLPYYVEPSAIANTPDRRLERIFYVRTFAVDSLRRFDHDGDAYGALHVRRLDRLNVGGTPLGYVRPDEPFAVVALDEIEAHAEQRASSLREDGTCGLANFWSAGRYATRADELCAETLWETLEAHGHGQDSAHERKQERWIFDVIVRNTERHELQHQVDGPDLETPAELFALVPLASDTQLERAARELSAYLCELASGDPDGAVWALADITDFLITESIVQQPERYAAGLIAEALVDRDVISPMGAVSNEAVAAIWESVASMPLSDAASYLRTRANGAHEELFGVGCAEYRELDDAAFER